MNWACTVRSHANTEESGAYPSTGCGRLRPRGQEVRLGRFQIDTRSGEMRSGSVRGEMYLHVGKKYAKFLENIRGSEQSTYAVSYGRKPIRRLAAEAF